jgi:hypothetical protein
MANNPEVAVLMPTSDELGVTIDRSINNLGLRMAERPDVNWSLHIGVNGSNAGEEIAKVNAILASHDSLFDNVQVSVLRPMEKGKELIMNALAQDVAERRGVERQMHIATDLKVYRKPGSLAALIDEFSPAFRDGRNPRYLGGTILPYPIDEYKKFFTLSPEQRLFYTLLEIDKDPDVRSVFPKTHLRGGLYITGAWTELPTDVSDDFTISRRARKDYGEDAVQLTENAVGYVIPRQSFADFFAVRFKRTTPNLQKLEQNHPDLVGLEKVKLSDEETNIRLEALRAKHPEKYALYQTKQMLEEGADILCRNIDSASAIIDEMQEDLGLPEDYDFKHMSLDFIQELANESPALAAKVIICHYRPIVEALAVDPDSVSYGPREERFRGMLPLD